MRDSHGHGCETTHPHGHDTEKDAEPVSGIEKLKKMTEYWINHNEEHAGSYRLWAGRARAAGYGEPGDILEQIASEVVEMNVKLRKVIQIIESAGDPG
jgi:hypothetical protein